MGRRHVFTRSELLDHAKRMLLEHGYEGFQLKSLSTRLPGARSTIYQYFANKEEIVAACMRRIMEGDCSRRRPWTRRTVWKPWDNC